MKNKIPFKEVRSQDLLKGFTRKGNFPLMSEALNSLSDVRVIIPMTTVPFAQAALEEDKIALYEAREGVSVRDKEPQLVHLAKNRAILIPRAATRKYLEARLGLSTEAQRNALSKKYVKDSEFDINTFTPFEVTEDIDDDSSKGVSAWRQSDKIFIEGSVDSQEASFSLVINQDGLVEASESYGEVTPLWGDLPVAGEILTKEQFESLVEKLNQD